MIELSAVKSAPRVPIEEGLRLYWRHLIPITILPIVGMPVIEFVGKPWAFWAFIPLFLFSGFYAGYPYLKKNVTYLFWIVALGFWMAGGMVGIMIVFVLRFVLRLQDYG